MFKKELIIDGKGHLLGRLASTVAKEILNGQHVVCNISYFRFYVFNRLFFDAKASTSPDPSSETS